MDSRTATSGDRLGFLDFARAIAALSVALMHVLSDWSPGVRRFTLDVFNPGVFGVITFFLVSGFVIPFSLERLASLRRFWTNRVFRLYPLYWFTLVGALLLYGAHLGGPPDDFVRQLPKSAIWNATMVHALFDVPSAIGLYWTLSYEMVFYVAMSVLFAVGWHKKSDWVLFAGAVLFADYYALQPLVHHHLRFHPPHFWILTFFVGSTAYRGWSGDLPLPRVRFAIGAFVAAVAAAVVVNYGIIGARHVDDGANMNPPAFVSGWVAAYAFFGLLLLFPKLAFPRTMLWLGRISYSVYLVHGLVLQIAVLPESPTALLLLRLVLAIGLSALTYRFVEEPFLRLGKKRSST